MNKTDRFHTDNRDIQNKGMSNQQVQMFTGYQKFIVGLLAFLQFTIVLDFMIISPLGAILLKDLSINTRQFGLVVSAYAFAAGISGILAAGFADRFDRKRLLLVFYTGFLAGTFFCSIAPGYNLLLAARIVTGFFGGVIGSINLSIVADLYPLQFRGRVMGTIQSAFSASQILGIPAGLFIANLFNWHATFLMIALIGMVTGLVIILYLKPLTTHLEIAGRHHPLRHLFNTVKNPKYLTGFTATMLVATGGFMLQPFASAFSVNNLGVSLKNLPMVYMISGLTAMAAGPVLGRISDSIGKFKMLFIASVAGCIWLIWYTSLGISPLWLVITANCFFALIISGRMSSTMALITAVPEPQDRGAYMSMSSAMQQFAGGISSWIAGLIIIQNSSGMIKNYNVLGWVVVIVMTVTMAQMYNINRIINQ